MWQILVAALAAETLQEKRVYNLLGSGPNTLLPDAPNATATYESLLNTAAYPELEMKDDGHIDAQLPTICNVTASTAIPTQQWHDGIWDAFDTQWYPYLNPSTQEYVYAWQNVSDSSLLGDAGVSYTVPEIKLQFGGLINPTVTEYRLELTLHDMDDFSIGNNTAEVDNGTIVPKLNYSSGRPLLETLLVRIDNVEEHPLLEATPGTFNDISVHIISIDASAVTDGTLIVSLAQGFVLHTTQVGQPLATLTSVSMNPCEKQAGMRVEMAKLYAIAPDTTPATTTSTTPAKKKKKKKTSDEDMVLVLVLILVAVTVGVLLICYCVPCTKSPQYVAISPYRF